MEREIKAKHHLNFYFKEELLIEILSLLSSSLKLLYDKNIIYGDIRT